MQTPLLFRPGAISGQHPLQLHFHGFYCCFDHLNLLFSNIFKSNYLLWAILNDFLQNWQDFSNGLIEGQSGVLSAFFTNFIQLLVNHSYFTLKVNVSHIGPEADNRDMMPTFDERYHPPGQTVGPLFARNNRSFLYIKLDCAHFCHYGSINSSILTFNLHKSIPPYPIVSFVHSSDGILELTLRYEVPNGMTSVTNCAIFVEIWNPFFDRLLFWPLYHRIKSIDLKMKTTIWESDNQTTIEHINKNANSCPLTSGHSLIMCFT